MVSICYQVCYHDNRLEFYKISLSDCLSLGHFNVIYEKKSLRRLIKVRIDEFKTPKLRSRN